MVCFSEVWKFQNEAIFIKVLLTGKDSFVALGMILPKTDNIIRNRGLCPTDHLLS